MNKGEDNMRESGILLAISSLPSTYGNNWKWPLLKDEFGEKEVKTLYEITKRYGRIGK